MRPDEASYLLLGHVNRAMTRRRMFKQKSNYKSKIRDIDKPGTTGGGMGDGTSKQTAVLRNKRLIIAY